MNNLIFKYVFLALMVIGSQSNSFARSEHERGFSERQNRIFFRDSDKKTEEFGAAKTRTPAAKPSEDSTPLIETCKTVQR